MHNGTGESVSGGALPRTKNERTKAAILGAAAAAFDAKDFHQVLTYDIAATAGIGKATLFRYFKTKEDLYFETLLSGFDELDAAIGAAGPGGDARARLEHVAQEVLRVFWNRRASTRSCTATSSASARASACSSGGAAASSTR